MKDPEEQAREIESKRNLQVSSPCVHLCQLDEHAVCLGCFRTLAEIAAWTSMSDLQKRRILAALAERSQTRKFRGTEGENE